MQHPATPGTGNECFEPESEAQDEFDEMGNMGSRVLQQKSKEKDDPRAALGRGRNVG